MKRGAAAQGTALVLAALAVLLAGVAGCTSGAASAPARAASAAAMSPTGSAPTGPAEPTPLPTVRANGPPLDPLPPPPSALPVAPGAGRLAQTSAFPSATSAAFKNAMDDLWLAVTTGKPRLALPAFFPVTAYEQVKAIADPEADWENRLWFDFTLDVASAHDLVGAHATLVRVIVPTEYAAWVYPGGCYNSIGYWHVPGSRVVYRQGSQLRSFGIASLISWRGVWYVVHFGAVIRSGAGGEVDDPTVGTGVPGPPGGC